MHGWNGKVTLQQGPLSPARLSLLCHGDMQEPGKLLVPSVAWPEAAGDASPAPGPAQTPSSPSWARGSGMSQSHLRALPPLPSLCHTELAARQGQRQECPAET